MKVLKFSSLMESVNMEEITEETLYWKIYTKYSGRIVEIALYKIDLECLEEFRGYIKYMKDCEFIWLYKYANKNGRTSIWDWDESRIKDPERDYDEKFRFMGEINVTKEDIDEYRIYLDAKKYNL
jgi:hypothetical protein